VLLFRIPRIIWEDILLSSKFIGIYLGILIIGLIYNGKFISHRLDPSIPDMFSTMFQGAQFLVILVPVYLLLLSLIFPASFNTLRLFRYGSRERFTAYIFVTIFIITGAFLFIYMLAGFIYGFSLTGTLKNSWTTEIGYPYMILDGQINLETFKISNLISTYVITEMLVFIIIGLIAAIIYAILKRYVFSFFIVQGLILLDFTMEQLFNTSLFVKYAQITLYTWSDIHFGFVIVYFLGIIIVLTTILYLVINKRDFTLQGDGYDDNH